MSRSVRSAGLAVVAALGVVAALAGCTRGGVPSTRPPAPDGASGGRPSWWEVPPRNGLEVIGWMRRAHPSRELKSLRFTLTMEHHGDAPHATQEVVTMRLPGAVTSGMPGARLSSVRSRDRHTTSRDATRVGQARSVDLVALLAFDVFAQNADTTIMWLDSARVRFGLARRGEWNGRGVWIVGAQAGDTASTQFWVDAEYWRVVRVIQHDPRDDLPSDVRLTSHTELLGVPVPTRIEAWREGRLIEVRAVSDVVVNPAPP